MRSNLRLVAASVLSAFLLVPVAVTAADVEVLFDAEDQAKTIFPSNLFTVLDFSQNTFRRVDLDKPDCAVNQVRCDDVDVLNTLDGFNLQPRISIPFSGPIDVSTVNSDSVFLVSLGSTRGRGSFGDKVGINQIVWDPESNTLHVESDELLEQHTRYAVIVTDRVKDADGDSIRDKNFSRFHHDLNFGQKKSAIAKEFREDLLQALLNARRHHGDRIKVVAASVFTTMSVTAELQKIQDQIQASAPGPVDFNVGTLGQRAYFPLPTVLSATITRQIGTAPTFAPPAPLPIPFAFNLNGPGVVGALAFGKYSSPIYVSPDVTFPPIGTRTGTPVAQGMNVLHFNITLPSSAKPAAGYPVAIYGHGFTDNKLGSFPLLAASMAQQGIALVTINVVGHGFGPLGTVRINTTTGPVTVPAGGRGIDQNGDGNIDITEGSNAAAPRSLIGSADALRQTTVDLMQLVRQIQAGVDVDGDTVPDLDPARIYYFGQSFGGIYGTIFLGVEPGVRVGVPNVGGGATIEIIRLSPVFRPLATGAVAVRGLLNAGTQFVENMPLRNEPPRINDVAGAMGIQDFIDQSEWGTQRGNPVAYAPHLRKNPLPGNPVKSVIIQYGKGDQTVPNPTQTAIVRAGELADRTTYYRHDLLFAVTPGLTKNPHTFLTAILPPPLSANPPAYQTVARQAQAQIATFFASDGALTVDPDGAGPLFETPIVPPLPETLNFIP
jgi:Bacterial Ig-like domain